MTQVLINFSSPCWYLYNLVPVSGRLSPHNLEMFSHKPTTSLLFSLLVFQQLRSTILLRMPFQAQLWHKLAFSSPFFYFNYLFSISSFRRLLLSSTHLLVLSGSCSFFLLIHITGVLCPLLKFFSPYEVFHLVSTGVFGCTSCPLQPFSHVFQPTMFW